jgi:hypothetical protein
MIELSALLIIPLSFIAYVLKPVPGYDRVYFRESIICISSLGDLNW